AQHDARTQTRPAGNRAGDSHGLLRRIDCACLAIAWCRRPGAEGVTGSRRADLDLAGTRYWDAVWDRTGEHRVGRLSYFHHAFAQRLDRHLSRGSQVCEVGCADSAWIPYLIERGVRVTGIDYSARGVGRLEAALRRRSMEAELVVTDVLDPSARP